MSVSRSSLDLHFLYSDPRNNCDCDIAKGLVTRSAGASIGTFSIHHADEVSYYLYTKTI